MGEELEHGPTNEAEVVTDSAEGDEAERADSIIELSNMTVLGNIGDSEVREVKFTLFSTSISIPADIWLSCRYHISLFQPSPSDYTLHVELNVW